MGHFIAALLGKLCADEVRAWLPSFAEGITKWAVRSLPKQLRERYDEEWRSHLNDVPGALAKVWVAWGFLSAATQTSSRIVAFWLYLFFLPVMGLMRCVFYLSERKMYSFPLTVARQRVMDMEPGARRYMENLGYSSNQHIRIEAWVKSREVPLGRFLHESLNHGSPLSKIYQKSSHYAFWKPSLSYALSDYIRAKRLDHLLLLTSVISGSTTLRDWYRAAMGQVNGRDVLVIDMETRKIKRGKEKMPD